MTKKDATQLMISGDPLTIFLSTLNYKNRLRKFVDNFFVGIHTYHYRAPHPTNPSSKDMDEVELFLNNLSKDQDDIKFVYPTENTTQHGTMLNELMKVVYDDCKSNLLITETDDFFVDADLLESHVDAMNRGDYDFVGEPRGCTNNNELIEFERKIVREDKVYVNSGADHHAEPGEFNHFWPTHFLIKKKFVNRDDRFEAFGPNEDELGKTINNKEIRYRGRKYFVKDTCGDTFVKFSIDMMSRINKGYEYIAAPTRGQDASTLYFLNHGLVNTPNYTIPPNIIDFAFKQFSIHTGSGSTLQLFPIISDKDVLLSQPVFRSINIFAETNDHYQLFELYRRFHVYRAGFEAVENHPEFAVFKHRCIQNFALLDEAFQKVNIDELLKSKGNWLLPREIYVKTFKRIIGDL